MSGYVYAGAPNVRGIYNTVEAQERADRLHDLFTAGVPVTASGDGLSFTAHGRRVPADAGEDEDHDT